MDRNQIYIFIDNNRKVDPKRIDKDTVLITCRTYFSAIEILKWCQDNGWMPWLDLGHDLEEGKTGYDICKFIVENNLPILGYTLHATLNPAGSQNMKQLLSNHGYTSF